MALSLQGWQDLHCECGNRHFQQAYLLAWHESHGTTSKPDGWTCTGCGRRSDYSKMVRRIKEQQLENKIKELREQL